MSSIGLNITTFFFLLSSSLSLVTKSLLLSIVTKSLLLSIVTNFNCFLKNLIPVISFEASVIIIEFDTK